MKHKYHWKLASDVSGNPNAHLIGIDRIYVALRDVHGHAVPDMPGVEYHNGRLHSAGYYIGFKDWTMERPPHGPYEDLDTAIRVCEVMYALRGLDHMFEDKEMEK